MEIEIQCPVHGKMEKLELPNSYRDFEGEVVCPTPVSSRGGTGAHIRVKIKEGKLISLERA